MKTILERIIDSIKKDEAKNFKNFSPDSFPLANRENPIDILPLLAQNFFIITEVKKYSPSKGIIRENFNPVTIACAYKKGGASAISVITEKNFFGGEKKYLSKIKEYTTLPILRKDFIIHPYQIYESFNLKADFLLLIVACLSETSLKRLYQLTKKLGMQSLIEVHNEVELQKALKLKPKIIGINNRDLKTFKVDYKISLQLKKLIPPNIHVISESGIQSHEQIMELKSAGFSGVLIGESLLKRKKISKALKELING